METSFKIRDLTIPHRLILAPMCGITLQPFRELCKAQGAGLVFNMMVSAKALTMGDQKTRQMMSYAATERPVGMQLFGNDADTLAEAGRIMQGTGVDVIDLNLGCPAKKIVNDGGGSALLQDEIKLAEIFSKMRTAITIPFTVKMRAGWDDSNRNAVRIAQIAEAEGIDAVAIHARTRAQGYSGKADWSFIKHLKAAVDIPVIGNGDVETYADAERMLVETGCDAVMTGRGAFERPWIFAEFIKKEYVAPTRTELSQMVMAQYESFRSFFGAEGGIKMMRKHLCTYTKGMRGGSEFRNELVRMTDWTAIRTRVNSFFQADAPGGLA